MESPWLWPQACLSTLQLYHMGNALLTCVRELGKVQDKLQAFHDKQKFLKAYIMYPVDWLAII